MVTIPALQGALAPAFLSLNGAVQEASGGLPPALINIANHCGGRAEVIRHYDEQPPHDALCGYCGGEERAHCGTNGPPVFDA